MLNMINPNQRNYVKILLESNSKFEYTMLCPRTYPLYPAIEEHYDYRFVVDSQKWLLIIFEKN